MTTKTEVVTAINQIKIDYALMDDALMDFLSSDETYGDTLPFVTDFIVTMKDWMTKFSSWKTDSSFKSIEPSVRKKIFKTGSIVSGAMNNHALNLEGLEALIDEALSSRTFDAEHPYLQRAVEKKVEDILLRISSQIWKLDKLKNMMD